ncbi:phosphatase PAP2 family protein [Sphaerisporangium fuscum]|uniref:phosphatase PAP2 family protein n=1 Tax=Sphaerisporangium fuscum TaxID=2835868 RepID=UPI002029A452|nr:phosphatase PAP2 family protein [Sphaerisporangium fuscum]
MTTEAGRRRATTGEVGMGSGDRTMAAGRLGGTTMNDQAGPPGRGGWLDRRLDPDARLGLRLTLASLAVVLVLVPFTLLLVLVKTSFPPLYRLDEGVANTLHAYAVTHSGWVTFLEAWTDVFGPGTWRVVVGVAVVWLVIRRAPRLAAWAVTTITVGGLLGLGLKVVVDRARPHLPNPVALAPGASFPSGHALNATLGVGIVLLLILPFLTHLQKIIAWTVGAVIVLGVAYTRIALGVHWVSDVTAGVVFGVAVVAATTAAFETWRRDIGRRPAEPHLEGVEPEAKAEISPKGRAHGHKH